MPQRIAYRFSPVTPSADFPSTFNVGRWTADSSLDQLALDGQAVKLEPRTMRLLVTLARAGGSVVTTEHLLDAVWPGLVVTLGSLYEAVAQLRKVLGPEHVATIPRRGYRLVAPVSAAAITDRGESGSRPASNETSASKLGPRSISVLPFRLRNVPEDHAFLRESLTEDLIAELSLQPSLVVVARGTMLSFVNSKTAPADICRDLGARYGVEGLIEVRGTRLRVTAQVIDAVHGTQTSADTIELALSAWPETGSLVIERLARALNFELFGQAARLSLAGGEVQLMAVTLATRSWIELFARTESMDSNDRAVDWAKQALARDPRLPLAFICLAFAEWRSAQFGWDDERPAELVRRAREHADRAIELDPGEPDAYYVSGLIAYSSGEVARAEEALRHCLRLSASHAPAHGLLALIRTRRGYPVEAGPLCERALALSPREPLRVVWYLARAWAALDMGDYESALEDSQRAMAVNPDFATCYVTGAAAAQQLGARQLAASWVEFLKTRTAFRSLRELEDRLPPATEPAHMRQMQQVIALLGDAGLPLQ